jgi:hypothetical protein
MGVALSVAQFGGRHPKAKLWKGEGSGVLEIVEDHRGGHVSRGVHRKVRESCVCITCIPEEIAEGHKNIPNGCGVGFSQLKRGISADSCVTGSTTTG